MRFLPALLAASAALFASAQAALIANFHPNFSGGTQSLFIFGDVGTTGTVTNNAGFSQSFTIDSTGVFNLNVGTMATMPSSVSNSVNGRSFRIDANNPISGLALNREGFTSDMTGLLDVTGLGNDYYVMGFTGVFGEGGQFSVTATRDNTQVTITPSVAINGNPAGVPFTVTLNAGESVKYNAVSGDVTGTRVTANNDVAVFGGAACTQVPVGVVACDHLISQNFSTDNYGERFVISDNFGGGTDSDLVRVLAAEDNTEVFVNGVSRGTINAGQFLTIDQIGDAVITTNNPVTVGQYLRGQGGTRDIGDPGFSIVPAENQWLRSYAFSTPVGSEAYPQNFLNIAILTSDIASLRLNGMSFDTSMFTTAGAYSLGNVAIPVGFGTISAAIPFLAMIAGFSNFDSYFSSIATSFSPGTSPPPDPDPIPLPAALPLFLAGLAGIGFAKRRRKA
jgi:hypothetical protein